MKYSKEFKNVYNILNNPHIFSKSFQKVHRKAKSPLHFRYFPIRESFLGNVEQRNGLLYFLK